MADKLDIVSGHLRMVSADEGRSQLAIDHMIFEFAGFVLVDRPAADRLAGAVNRVAKAGITMRSAKAADAIAPVIISAITKAGTVSAALAAPHEMRKVAMVNASG